MNNCKIETRDVRSYLVTDGSFYYACFRNPKGEMCMAKLSVNNLTFCYEGSFDNIFENVSFSVDTDWKLGFIGRNGKGKTTFLNLLLGKYEYEGSINTSVVFDYFPYRINEAMLEKSAIDFVLDIKPECEFWKIYCELDKMGADGEILDRPFNTLSFGERTKVLLAVLFSGENEFLLIDEPTNHLDRETREIVKKYLASKSGFILVSHDRDLLDAVVDHVLVLNKNTIEVQAGNFSSWYENKEKKDAFALAENTKHIKEIGRLQESAKRAALWAEKNEGTKIGFDPKKEPDRCVGTRAYIGAKTKKMQSRVKNFENRIQAEIQEKEGLLQDIEKDVDLKLFPLEHHKEVLVSAYQYGLGYNTSDKDLFENMTFEIKRGDRVFLNGDNGCGKTSLIKAIFASIENDELAKANMHSEGELRTAAGLTVSYINQDTSYLAGDIKTYCKKHNYDESLFCSLLRQLDMERVQFTKNMEDFSEGQKKKVLIASSLLTAAHLYIWDEPLNYIDVFSRMQIERLIEKYQPTMLIVEHDVKFREKLATKIIDFK